MDSIATGHEVIRAAPVDPSYPLDIICDSLFTIERDAFRNCFLGMDFYNTLKGAKIKYTNVDEYSDANTYATSDLVLYDGQIWVSTSDANDISPGENINSDSKWSLAPKFSNSDYEFLWHHGLLSYISFLAIAHTCVYVYTKAGAAGVMMTDQETSGLTSVSTSGFNAYKHSFMYDAVSKAKTVQELMREMYDADNTKFTDFFEDDCNECEIEHTQGIHLS